MSKEENKKFIHELTIASSVANVCKDLHIGRTNVSSGRTTEDKMQEVADELVRRIQEVLKKYGK